MSKKSQGMSHWKRYISSKYTLWKDAQHHMLLGDHKSKQDSAIHIY